MKKIFYGLFFLLIITVPQVGLAGECIDWSKVLTQEQFNTAQKNKTVLIKPFTNYTKNPADDWLQTGLPELLSLMLNSSTNLQPLFGNNIKYHPQSNNPDYSISGMYQHLDGNLRAFIKLWQGNEKQLLAQYTLLVPIAENIDFFSQTAEIVKQAAKKMEASLDENKLKEATKLTNSIKAFENYVKGVQAFQTYKTSEMEVARIWFEQTVRLDYKSELGYNGLIDLYTFLGYYHKQRQQSFGKYFEQASQEEIKRNRLTGKKDQEIKNRFLLGNAAFSEALILAQTDKLDLAAAALKKAVQYVPEDAISWYQLARIYDKLGQQKESTEAIQKAYAINPCIEE
ncbi:MAG: tetratricopeptide repeat protein [Pseudomonadota bacterium]